MWVPEDTEHLERLIPQGVVEESATLDFKSEVSGNSKEVAKDIAAMANDGGVLIFGVGENEVGRPTLLKPFKLDGVSERISSIARASIAPPPTLEIKTLAKPLDEGLGYLIVIVPSSPMAPHMVTVGKENRYYGRSAMGNIVLTEAEVSRLYERRKSWTVDREALLDRFVASAPVQPSPDFGYIHLFAKPVGSNTGFLRKATKDGAERDLIQELITIARSPSVSRGTFSPAFGYGESCPIAEGWVIYMGEPPEFDRKPKSILDLEIHFDGGAHLFCGRAAERIRGALRIFEGGIAVTALRFLSLLGEFYRRSSYFGPVDIGVALTTIGGGVSNASRERYDVSYNYAYRDPEYRSTVRTTSSALLHTPVEVARELLGRFFHAILGGAFDPLEEIGASG